MLLCHCAAKNFMVLANGSWDIKLTHVAQYAVSVRSDAELSCNSISDLTVPVAEIAAPEVGSYAIAYVWNYIFLRMV